MAKHKSWRKGGKARPKRCHREQPGQPDPFAAEQVHERYIQRLRASIPPEKLEALERLSGGGRRRW
jgi:hypothetical protein